MMQLLALPELQKSSLNNDDKETLRAALIEIGKS
jgi:hypothetical protein